MPHEWKRVAAQGRLMACEKCLNASLQLITQPDPGVRSVGGEAIARGMENLLKAYILEQGGMDNDHHNFPELAKECHRYDKRLKFLLNHRLLAGMKSFVTGGFYYNPELDELATPEYLRELYDFVLSTRETMERFMAAAEGT